MRLWLATSASQIRHTLMLSKGGDLSENWGVGVFPLPSPPLPSPPPPPPLPSSFFPFMESDSEPKFFLGSPDACRWVLAHSGHKNLHSEASGFMTRTSYFEADFVSHVPFILPWCS
jgi:hypothetical protein